MQTFLLYLFVLVALAEAIMLYVNTLRYKWRTTDSDRHLANDTVMINELSRELNTARAETAEARGLLEKRDEQIRRGIVQARSNAHLPREKYAEKVVAALTTPVFLEARSA